MEPTNIMYNKLAEGIFVGNIAAAKSVQTLANLHITAIINISGVSKDWQSVQGVDRIDFMLPSQELLESERPKTILKLETIAGDIHTLRNNNRVVLINCFDGKNKCMLAAGYYFITKCKWTYAETIYKLETLYFSDSQKDDDLSDRKRILAESDPDTLPPIITAAELQRITAGRDERRELRCLTMSSFSKVLRLAGGAKK